LLVAARDRGGGRGNVLKMISHASRLIDWNLCVSRYEQLKKIVCFS
jgi:hypothetical protein